MTSLARLLLRILSLEAQLADERAAKALLQIRLAGVQAENERLRAEPKIATKKIAATPKTPKAPAIDLENMPLDEVAAWLETHADEVRAAK